MNLQKEMDIIKVQSDLEGEIRRLHAIRYCLTKSDNNMDITLEGLDLAIKSLEKDVKVLSTF